MKLFASLIILTVLRLLYIGQVELSPDEAYYHQWSQRLDWCYFSKGPGIAATMWASTSLFGHGEFGVRAFAPLLALGTSLMLYWLARRIYNERVALWTVVILNVTPIFNVSGLLMTIDPLSIFFWCATLCTLWRAFEESPKFSLWWPLSGVLIGLGFLCKWTNAFLLLSVLLLLLLTPRYRRELWRPGFWSMILLFLPALLPVYYWQEPRGWPLLNHLSARGGLETPWWQIGLKDFFAFIGSHFGVYSPLIFAGMLVALWVATKDSLLRWLAAVPRAVKAAPRALLRHWALVIFVGFAALSCYFAGNFFEEPRLHKAAGAILGIALVASIGNCRDSGNIHWKARFLTAFAMPVVLVYFWIALHHDAEVNWTAPAAVGVFILTAAHWLDRVSRPVMTTALALSVAIAIVGIEPDIVRSVGIPWEFKRDPSARLRQWKKTAELVADFRAKMEAKYGQPIFLIAENYGVAGALCQYLPPRPPEVPGHPACYVEESPVAQNQFHFWGRYDEYEERTALVTDKDNESSEYGVSRFAGRTAIYITTRDKEMEPPDALVRGFEKWWPGPEYHITENGKFLRLVRIFICERYKPGQLLD